MSAHENQGTWVDVMALADLSEWMVTAAEVAGKDIALYEVEGKIFASDNRCTHGAARLSDGFLEGNEIECPLHQGRFDVCTGKALCAPLSEDLQTYAVRVEDKRIWIRVV